MQTLKSLSRRENIWLREVEFEVEVWNIFEQNFKKS